MPYDNQDYGYEEVVTNRESRTSTQTFLLPVVLSLLKRPWLSIGSIFLVMIPIVFYLYSQVPRYKSVAIVSLTVSDSERSLMSKAGIEPIGQEGVSEEFYLYILESYAFRDHLSKRVLEAYPHLPPDSVIQIIRDDVSDRRKSSGSSFLYLNAVSESPEFAQFLASQAVFSFQQLSTKLTRSNADVVAKFTADQLDTLNSKLGQKEAELQDFLRSRQLTEVDVAGGVSSELRELERNLTLATANRDMAKLQIDTYTKQIDERFNKSVSDIDETITQKDAELRKQLDDLNILIVASIKYSSDSMEVNRLRDERKLVLLELVNLTHKKSNILSERGFHFQIPSAKIESELENSLIAYENCEIERLFYQSTMDNYIKEHPNLSQDILEYFNIFRAKDVLQTATNILIEKHEKIRIEMAAESGGVRVIDDPRIPDSPIPQSRGRKLGAAFIVALVIGFALAYSIDLFDNTVQGEMDIITKFNLPVYGSIPVLSLRGFRSRRHNPIVFPAEGNGKFDLTHLDYHSESSPVAEAYRSIRTALLFTAREKQQKSFVISSAVAGEGKSLTTYNLGVSFAQGGHKVLVVDADLRRSSLHKFFNLERSPGLTEYLLGDLTVADIFAKTDIENLKLICSGTKVNNPADLLSSHKMRQFLDEVSPLFDIILFDSPPVTPCMDSRNLANIAGGMIYIVRAELTKMNILEHSISLTNRVNVDILGVIVNYASFRYGYGYYYLYHRYHSYGYYSGGYSYYYYSYYQDSESKKETKKRKRKLTSKESDKAT